MGPGAVGITVAVALSVSGCHVVLAGSSCTGATRPVFSVRNYPGGEAEIPLVPISSISGRSNVVAALKVYDLEGAVPDILRIAEGFRIVCLSNGMGFDSFWGTAADSVEYAVLTAGFRSISPLTTSYEAGEIFCGSGGTAEKLFSGTSIQVHPVRDMEGTRWAKWYVNSIINPAGAITGLPNNRLRESSMGPVIETLSRELAASAPSQDALSRGRMMLDDLLIHSSNMCSMLQDIQAGRPTEIDHLTGLAADYSPAARELAGRIRELSAGT